ncbi:MAG: xanthine dehydrogenase family protein molybdopterin-binding subunit, partial [bacterium]
MERVDGPEMLCGQALYGPDVRLPGMLWGKILRSPVPHAKILRVDLEKAKKHPGVRAVICAQDVPARLYGYAIEDEHIFAIDTVHYVGQPVAAVAAVDEDTAEEALGLIEVDYELLAFVLDHEEAMKPDAPKIWPEGNLSLNNRDEAQPIAQRRGDVESGFRGADHVFEDRFSTAFVHNAQMEPRAAVAVWAGDKVTVYTPTGGIANCRTDMARDLGIP